jgi:hypothetical protein
LILIDVLIGRTGCFQILGTHSADEAIKILEGATISAVVTDIDIPGSMTA